MLEKIVYGFMDDAKVVRNPMAVPDVRVVNRQQFKLQKIINLTAKNHLFILYKDDA